MHSIGNRPPAPAPIRPTPPGRSADLPRVRPLWLVPLLALVLAGGFASSAHASHFRYVALSWSLSTNSPGEVIFHLSSAFRRSTYSGTAVDGRPQTGDIITENIGGTTLNFGDGGITPTLRFLITAYSPTEDWFVGQAVDPCNQPQRRHEATNVTSSEW